MSEPGAARAALIEAIQNRDVAAMEAALADGIDANASAGLGDTMLSLAAATGAPDVVRVLLRHGAVVDASGPHGNTALMQAAARGHGAVIEVLLEAGASPGHENKWGMTARDWSKWSPTAAETRALLGGG